MLHDLFRFELHCSLVVLQYRSNFHPVTPFIPLGHTIPSDLVLSAALIAAITFEPKKAVPVQVGKLTVNMYPQVDASMPIWERAHAFHLNRSACAASNADLAAQLEALGSQLNLESIVDGCRSDFNNHYRTNWMNMQHLCILSFHTENGRAVDTNDACVAGDPNILKPVQDGPLNACRPAGIKFVRVMLTLDFLSPIDSTCTRRRRSPPDLYPSYGVLH